MKNNRRFGFIILLLLLLLLSCSCRQNNAPAVDPEAEIPATAEDDAAGEILFVEETPEYVYLPQEDDSENLVFSGWVEENAGDGATADAAPALTAKYRDVSDTVNAIAIPSVYAQAGEVFSTPLRLCGQVELCALDIRVDYDPSRLRFVEIANADDNLVANCDAENGLIYVNYLQIINLQENFVLGDLTFEVLSEEECATVLTIQPQQVVSLDQSENIVFCNFATENGTVYLNAAGR